MTSANIVTNWITAEEAAAHAKVGVKVIYRACKSRKLRHARIGGRRDIRTRPEWVDSWLEACATPLEDCA